MDQENLKVTSKHHPHFKMANAIRVLAMDAVEKAQSGHPGMPMGMADIATVLFSEHLKFDPQNPEWPDRDRFIISNGHGSMLLYAVNYLTGYKKMTLEELKNFRQLGSHTAGHPEVDHSLGIETTTGPLGQGLANAVGMALAERLLNAEFGDELVNHHTYVFAGDGCLMEGISHEAISLAGHLKLSKLILFFDDNGISIDGSTDLSVSDDQLLRFQASGWHTQAIDGHDPEAISLAIQVAQKTAQPSLIACRTTIGFGAPHKAGTAAAHGSPLGLEEISEARKELDWPYAPFEIPQDILAWWRDKGLRNVKAREAWQKRLACQDPHIRSEFERRQKGELPQNWQDSIHSLIKEFIEKPLALATRQLSQSVLDILAQAIAELLGGSADLTGSNNTRAKNMNAVIPGDYRGRYIYYGVREHAMAAVMNGICLHKGFIPYGGTFLTFSDYCRPSIRLAALMKIPTIFVMTHDSIGLGEDGPTHQPIEHLASLRAIPNLNVFRPSDGVEVAECWMLAVASKETPSVIVLTRQKVPHLRLSYESENLSAKGGYLLYESKTLPRQVTLIATGSEVSLAVSAHEQLESQGIRSAVVSMPCWRLFDQQPEAYRREVLGDKVIRVAIEAASPFGWDHYLGEKGVMIGMQGFGASAPAELLYQHFGITIEKIVERVLKALPQSL
jgi:transketolase